MEITKNTTPLLAGVTCLADVEGHDHAVVVIKGTFVADAAGVMHLAELQEVPSATDQHHGAPESSSVRYESDFAPYKPFTDVVLDARAVAPRGKAVESLLVRLEVGNRIKDVVIHGERQWLNSSVGIVHSRAVPFEEMPIMYERAWGGGDFDPEAGRTVLSASNPVGVGFHPLLRPGLIDGRPLPNAEAPEHPVASPRERYQPAGFGVVGRSWQPRLQLAGTYDERWRESRAPFLPVDFDERHYQCAPEEQQFEHFMGGEVVRCMNMAEREVVGYVVPRVELPVTFRFAGRDEVSHPVLDTISLEPHSARASLVWRASVRLGKKLNQLREVWVGTEPSSPGRTRVEQRGGKKHYPGLGAMVEDMRRKGRGN